MYTKLLSHVLAVEFPELAASFQKLAQDNGHFAKLMQEYTDLDQQITADEEDVRVLEDEVLENLKKQRMAIKDQLYQAATAAAGKA